MSIDIRPATQADIPELVAFQVAMAAESEAKDLNPDTLTAGIRHLFDEPRDGHYLVATSNGENAGSLLVTFEWSDWRNGRFWWIQSVFVKPEHRRTGVYRALHDAIVAEAKQDPLSCGIRLYVEEENHGAQATYRTMGMHRTHYQLFEEEF